MYFYRTSACLPVVFSGPAFPPASTASPPPRHPSSAVWLTSGSISPSKMERCIASPINSAPLTTRMGRPWVKSTAVVSVEQCFTRATRLCLPRKRCVPSSGARSCRKLHRNHACSPAAAWLRDSILLRSTSVRRWVASARAEPGRARLYTRCGRRCGIGGHRNTCSTDEKQARPARKPYRKGAFRDCRAVASLRPRLCV